MIEQEHQPVTLSVYNELKNKINEALAEISEDEREEIMMNAIEIQPLAQ